MQQLSLYTLFGGEFFNYCLLSGVVKLVWRKPSYMNPCLFLRDMLIIFISTPKSKISNH